MVHMSLAMCHHCSTKTHVSLYMMSLCGLAHYSVRCSTHESHTLLFQSLLDCLDTFCCTITGRVEGATYIERTIYNTPYAKIYSMCRLASSHAFDKGSPASSFLVPDEEARHRSSAEAFASWQNSGASPRVPQYLSAHRPPWDAHEGQQSSSSQGFPCVVLQAAGYARRNRR